MTATLFLGPGRELVESWIDRCAQKWKTDPFAKTLAIVPNHLVSRNLQIELARRLGSWANLRLMTLEELACRLAAPALRKRNKPGLKPLSRRILISSILREIKLEYLAPLAGQKGLVETLDALFHDLEEGGFHQFPEEAEGAIIPSMAKDLRTLYGTFRERVLDNYTTDLDVFDFACEQITGGTNLLGVNCISLVGFADFNYTQQRLLAGLAKVVALNIFVPSDNDDQQDYIQPLVRFAKRELHAGIERPVTRKQQQTTLDMARVRFMTDADYEPATEDGSLRILAVPDEVCQAREVVRCILARAREGVPFSEMAIAFSGEDTRQLLYSELESAKIPVYADGGISATTTLEGKLLERIAGVVAGRWRWADVMPLVRLCMSNQMKGPDEKLYPVDVSSWDLVSRKLAITEGATCWQRCLTNFIGSRTDAFKEVEDKTTGEAGKCVAAHQLLAWLSPLIQLGNMIEQSGSTAELWSQVHAAVKQVVPESEVRKRFFSDLKIVEEDEFLLDNLARAEIPSIIQSIVDGLTLEHGRFRDGCVALIPFHRMRHLSFRHVVLAGLVENKIPSMGRQDPLLLDEQRWAINRKTKTDRLPLKGERYEEQVYLFRQLLDSASESLMFTYPRFGRMDGRSQTPSHFLLRLTEGLTGQLGENSLTAAPGFMRMAADQFGPGDPEDSIHAGEWELTVVSTELAAGDASIARGLLGVSGQIRETIQRRATRIYNLLIFTGDTPQDGRLGTKALKYLQARGGLLDGEISATRLETYARCPRQFLLGTVLKMEPLEEPGQILRLSAMDRGSLVHDVLREVFEQAKDKGLIPITEGNADKWIAGAAESLQSRKDAQIGSGKVRDEFFWEMECRVLQNDFKDQLDDERKVSNGYVPYAFEVRFGKAKYGTEEESAFSTDTPVVLELEGGGKIRLAGRIDRVDAHPQKGLRVIDYKTGKKTFISKNKKLVGGEGLQLPVYRRAAEMVFEKLAQAGVSAFYYHNTDAAGYKWAGIDQKEWAKVDGPFQKAVKTIVDGITEGRFFPNPFGKKMDKQCQYCPFVSYCGPGIRYIASRKRSAQGRLPFETMKGIA